MSMNEEAGSGVPANAVPVPELIQAYNETRADFEAVPEEKKVFMNLEVSAFAFRVLAHATAIESLEQEATDKVVGFDPALFRTVRKRALGMLQAHSLHSFAAKPVTDELPAHMERATALRARMIDSGHYLVRQGKLPADCLDSIKNQTGHRVTATDLLGLSNLYDAQWGTVDGKSAVTRQDVTEAATLAGNILDAMAAREDNERRKTETGEMRHKAYSLVFNQYDEIRRIVSFVRWHQDDADDFAPSLFSGRRSGSTKDKPTKDSPTDQDGPDGAAPVDGKPVTPAGGTVTPAGGTVARGGGAVAPGGGQAGAPVAGGQAQGTSPFAGEPVVPVGHQGGSPFVG